MSLQPRRSDLHCASPVRYLKAQPWCCKIDSKGLSKVIDTGNLHNLERPTGHGPGTNEVAPVTYTLHPGRFTATVALPARNAKVAES